MFIPTFYSNEKIYNLPGDFIKASHFTQYYDSSTSLRALSVRETYCNTWMKYISLKHKYGNNLKYMEIDNYNEQLTGTKDDSTKIEDTTNINEMVIASYIAASREAKRNNHYEIKYIVSSIPLIEGESDITVEPGDQILLVNNQSIKSKYDLEIVTADKEIKNVKVLRLGKVVEVKSSLYSIYIKIINDVKDKRSLQEAVELYDQNYTGNSAGAAVALELYNHFTKDIIKGRNIAITGSIDSEGTIGVVAGIPAKTFLAGSNNVEVLFVPFDDELANNYSDANKIKKSMKFNMQIIPVKTLKEVIDYLTVE